MARWLRLVPRHLIDDSLATKLEKTAFAGLAARFREHPSLTLPKGAAVLAALAYLVLFYRPLSMLLRDWWTVPEAGHGLLLAPIAVWLARRAGVSPQSAGSWKLGTTLLVGAILLRYASDLTTEFFTMRLSMIGALVGLTVFAYGWRQVRTWWLPFTLLVLAIPLPELVTQTLALPLQFKASQMGAALLEMREVPVHLSGNVIRIPGHELFVTEACSGLRSLTALISMSVLVGATMLRSTVSRTFIVVFAIPIAIAVNGVRVFLTGFLVYFVNPDLGTGFMHVTEGWLLFLVSLAALAGFTAVARFAEQRRWKMVHA